MSQGRRPVLLLGPLIWLAVVVVVATVTWRVIDSAGRQVLTSGPTPSLDATPSPGGPSRTPGGGATSEAPSAPSATRSHLPSEVPSERQLRSWRGSAGTVAAVCNGAQISLQSVTPNDGWRFEVGDRGPEEIEVEFKTGGEDERRTQVTAGCVSGAPRFRAQAND